MSRIGKVPVTIPAGVTVNLDGSKVKVSGKLGELNYEFNQFVTIEYDNDNSKIQVKAIDESTQAKSMWGLSRSLLNNMVKGVSEGYAVQLEVNGVGYRCSVDKNVLTLFLGFSHEIKYAIPTGITIKCEKPTLIEVSGVDKQKVGQVAAVIRKLRPPEPYKGKGIKRAGEKIRRKEGKKK